MAQKNRANMLTDIVSNIYNNLINFITGQNAQDRFVNLLDSSPNILSDASQANGYVSTDANNEMFSSYYDEEISRADLISDLTANLAVGGKFYRINDAVGNTITLLVIAESNINLYSIGTDITTGEQGTYDITLDVFTPLSGSGNANITTITVAALQALETAGTLSLTTLYIIIDAAPFDLMCKSETVSQLSKTATIVDNVYSGVVQYDLQGNSWDNGSIYDADGNVFSGTLPSSYTLGVGSIRNNFFSGTSAIFGTGCEGNTLYARADVEFGNSCIGNTVGVGVSGFIFDDNLVNTTIDGDIAGFDCTNLTNYGFLYGNLYASTIFKKGTDIYHRYFDPANNRIVVTLMTAPFTVSYIGGGGVPYTGATADVDLGIHSLTADTIGIGVAAGAEKLHIDGGATTTRVKIDADNGVSRILSFRTDDLQRWALRVDGTESGSNSGADFQLRRYNDAGAHIDNPIAINRANGNITTAQNINGATPTELGYLSGLGSQAVGTTDTNILTNKRITARTGTVASDATPTINTDNVDFFSITAQTAAITSFSTNLTGTPTIGQTLWIAITGTAARAITWGASFEASTIALPTTTVSTNRLDVAFIWTGAIWRCVGVA